MRDAAADLEFEEAARLRDEIKRLEQMDLAIADDRWPAAESKAQESAGTAAGRPGCRRPRGRAGGRRLGHARTGSTR